MLSPRSHRLLIAATMPSSFTTYLAGQARFLAEHFEVVLLTSPGPRAAEVAAAEGVRVHTVNFTRSISPRRDLAVTREIASLIRAERPDIVHSYTPKAGLLTMLAARAAGVPHRFHTVLGLPSMEATGLRLAALSATERITYSCATQVFSISHTLIPHIPRTLPSRPVGVIGHGSPNGVDFERFTPEAVTPEQRDAVRTAMGIPAGDRVVLFVGRLVGDKGIRELVDAFVEISPDRPVWLVLVGEEEPDVDPLPERTRALIAEHPRIRTTGWSNDVRPYLAASDVLVLPSYREGMGMVLVEAGGMGLPVIASDIPGCQDVVQDGHNGLLVPAKNTDALTAAIRRIIDDRELHRRLSAQTRASMVARYDQNDMHAAFLRLYRDALREPVTAG